MHKYSIVIFNSEPGISCRTLLHTSSFIQVLIRRRPLLYVVGLLLPSTFLMLVDVMSFYLPLNSGTRITFKTSILLGYTVFRVNMADELPVTAVRTPLIGGLLKSLNANTCFIYVICKQPGSCCLSCD